MSKGKELSKGYVFYKNLYRPGVITPPKDKKLTVVHKLIVALVLKPRKFKDIPSTISYFEWDHVKTKFKNWLWVSSAILFPFPFWFLIAKPIRERENRWMEKVEMKNYGEIREGEKIPRWW